MSIHASRSLGL